MANRRKYNDGTKLGNHCVYRLQYHVVFVTKYRRPCITDEMGIYMVENADRILKQWQGRVLEGKSDKDHIHLLIEMHPKYELSKYIGVLKQTLSRIIRRDYPEEVNRYLWGDAFWSKSFYIATAGGASLETLKKYIESQGKKPNSSMS